MISQKVRTLREGHGRLRKRAQRGTANDRGWAHPEPVETHPRSALSARMRVGRLARMDEHHDRRACRLDRLRGPSRPGIGARAAEVHDHPMGRGAAQSPITGSSSRQRPSLSAGGGGGSSARGRGGGRRNSTCPTAPSPSRRARPTGSPIARSAKPLTTGRCGAPSSCGASSGRTAASATMSPSRNGCACRTYDRKLEEIFAAEEVVDAHLAGVRPEARASLRR